MDCPNPNTTIDNTQGLGTFGMRARHLGVRDREGLNVDDSIVFA